MKTFFKIFLKYYLKIIVKAVIIVRRPTIIAVAGSINKNFVKKEVKTRLQELGLSVRANPKNFNTEIGLPLAILYLESGYNEYKKWLPIILKAPAKIFQKNFPQYLVLSLGTSDEGDMKYLLSMVKPQISIITDITQRYKEGFSDMDNLVEEYKTLARKTDANGLLVLNGDNYRIREIGKSSKQRVVYYGFDPPVDIRARKTQKTEKGQELEVELDGNVSQHHIYKFGRHHVYAFMVGLIIKQTLMGHYDQHQKKN